MWVLKWTLVEGVVMKGEMIIYQFKNEQLMAASEKGLCALFLGNDEVELVNELQRRFPKAELMAGEVTYTGVLDERGTSFQKSVWKALREIPIGKTMTYSEVALRVGKSDAVRAVGTACGANPIAIITPCHRVVGKDGKLHGYRWGLDKKIRLLEMEKV